MHHCSSLAPVALPLAVRRELSLCARLAVLFVQSWVTPWLKYLYMVDASPTGGGVVRARGSVQELRREAALGERTGWMVARAFDFLEFEESGEQDDPTDALRPLRVREPG